MTPFMRNIKIDKSIETECILVVASGCRHGRIRSSCLMHMGFYLGVMKIFEDKIEVVVAPPIQNVLFDIELFNIKL